jgi:hypothetical protein
LALTEVETDREPIVVADPSPVGARVQPRDLQRTFQLLLATVWLLDAVLQLQPFMFTRGSNGFSGMLNGLAAGNPGWVARTITWNGSIVYHQPILTNTAFLSIQFLIAFGIVWKRSIKPALALSIVWSLGVWWFGEGAGGIFQGGATPFGGGPGGVLFYAVLAVLLWPSEGSDLPFVAARTVGVAAARWIWVATWGVLAVLALVGSGRSPQALHDLIAGLDSGQPGWLAHVDRLSESFFLHHGTAAAILLAILCVVVAAGVFLPVAFRQVTLVVAMVVFAAIWVAVQNFGGILAGGATDPNSGLLVVLLALVYWPLPEIRSRVLTTPADLATAAKEV